ncbi:hypothetical protein EVAR_74593_1 [Eumeta japonica]|uniref:Uncharacterized protein n=1 Tax=Eumeta variegata TaxID=151549 RepID=A0A4C1W9M5_EUMVA|nr:hypothetical protein EVAR_74593_1 [Eumeta japonica]
MENGKGRCGPPDSGHAQSQGAIELRWERPSPGVPTVRPLSVHAYRRDKVIRRRDRTRQPVTTPQLVTPLESVKHCNGDFGYRRVSLHPDCLFTMRTLFYGRRISCSVAAWSIMDSVFFFQTLLSRASQDDGWLATVSDAPLPLHFMGGASVAHVSCIHFNLGGVAMHLIHMHCQHALAPLALRHRLAAVP